ncbi:MAG: Ivy family c-type lysozyme inhibitor [Beijerinckiaceae bacterium]
MRRVVIFAACAAALFGSAHAQSSAVAPHPADLIKQPGFKESWTLAMKGEKFERRDSWVPALSGPGSGDFWIDPAGKQWLEGNSCQPHNCGDNHLVILADPVTRKIVAMQRTRGETPASQRFFGKPDANLRKLLLARLMATFH